MTSEPAQFDCDSATVADVAADTQRHFNSHFDADPDWIVAAPGRVNIIGEHTDYNDGFVLPMAIERYVVIAAGAGNDEPKAVIHSIGMEETVELPLEGVLQRGPVQWANYVEGVIAGFQERQCELPAFNAVIHSCVPLGGGLSSSAALEVATATLLEAILDTSLDTVDKALLCQQAEHRFAGVPCGIMDQFSSVFGEENALMLLDCRSQQIESVPFLTDDIVVLITNSNVKHELTGGEYAERRSQCETAAETLGIPALRDATLETLEASREKLDDVCYQRARHVISEIARTVQAAEACRQQQWDAVGELMYASHDSLRDDYAVSCEELDLLVDIAREIGPAGGVIGSRMTGGGFGGCTVSLVRADAVDSVSETLRTRYTEQTGIAPTIFASRPARGAFVIRAAGK